MREYTNKKLEEMTLEELIKEATGRIIDSKTKFRRMTDTLIGKVVSEDDPEAKRVTQLDCDNNRRIHALRTELMKRGFDWFDVYSWSKEDEEE